MGMHARYRLIVDSRDGNRVITFFLRKELHPVIVKFTVRPDQGAPSGFDLGDMAWVGELGEARSAGQSPDQAMMIHVSVTQLLDCLGDLLGGRTKSVSFTGAASSFRLRFTSIKQGIRTAGPSGPVSILAPGDFTATRHGFARAADHPDDRVAGAAMRWAAGWWG